VILFGSRWNISQMKHLRELPDLRSATSGTACESPIRGMQKHLPSAQAEDKVDQNVLHSLRKIEDFPILDSLRSLSRSTARNI